VAILIGVLASLVCYYAVALKNRMQWDDALDVWGVHGVGGVVGVTALGLAASKAYNAAGADGLANGDASFFMKEMVTVIGAAVVAFVFTYLMLALINAVSSVKVSAQEEELGLDVTLHGEQAYI